MNFAAEYKIRKNDDTRKWEEIPVSETRIFHAFEIDRNYELAQLYAKSLLAPGVFEVRWNEVGSLLGHYAWRFA